MPTNLSKSDFDPSAGALVYTDGSASTKLRTGGWGWVAIDGYDAVWSDSGAETDTTISQMELYAPAMALYTLGAVEGLQEILIVSDSQYVVQGFNNKKRARRANLEYWGILEDAASMYTRVIFEHVKGHKGDYWNEIVDKLAVNARKKLQDDIILSVSGIK